MAPALAAMYNIILRWPKEGQQANGSDGEWERQEDEDAQKVAAARLPASLYSAWTIFFAKAGDLTRPENWRPITLLNTDYKILVSMLTARLPPPPTPSREANLLAQWHELLDMPFLDDAVRETLHPTEDARHAHHPPPTQPALLLGHPCCTPRRARHAGA